MNLKIERLEPSAQLIQKRSGFRFTLEPREQIIRVAYNDHVATSIALAPLLDPEVVAVLR
jgi:hypothetical protein